MLKSVLGILFLSVYLQPLALAQGVARSELNNLKNDKEVVITSFKEKERIRILSLYKEEGLQKKLNDIFLDSVQDYLESENLKCEFKLISSLENRLASAKLGSTQLDIVNHLKFLRTKNEIDDILFGLLTGVNQDYFALKQVNLTKRSSGSGASKDLLANNDLNELYGDLKTWPDESERCIYQDYIHLKNSIVNKKDIATKNLDDLKKLNVSALRNDLIPLDVYNRLEYLRSESGINKRKTWLQEYFKVILNAKNKMTPISKKYVVNKIEEENDFASQRIKRFSKITKRKLLYEKYDETQIILLSQVLQKASRRMGADADTDSKRPIITQEFSVLTQNGERETYVEKIELDPQSQYNLARRLMRKDLLQLQMMPAFQPVKVTHEDVIMAALETGYISLEDIEFVVKYDDLWNPHKTEFEKVMGFIFNIGGYTTFFLPPPWNIAASIAMGVTESLVNKQFETGAENDNPATFIE